MARFGFSWMPSQESFHQFESNGGQSLPTGVPPKGVTGACLDSFGLVDFPGLVSNIYGAVLDSVLPLCLRLSLGQDNLGLEF